MSGFLIDLRPTPPDPWAAFAASLRPVLAAFDVALEALAATGVSLGELLEALEAGMRPMPVPAKAAHRRRYQHRH